MTGVRLDKPWRALTEAEVERLGGWMGVYEVATRDDRAPDGDRGRLLARNRRPPTLSRQSSVIEPSAAPPEPVTVLIGYAGGRSRFGLRGELSRHLEEGTGTVFRYEVTTAYLSRYRELLAAFRYDHGVLPPGNAGGGDPVGRLSPA